MRLPIRVRLTAWYVGLLALVIATLGAFVLVRLRADLTADLDRSLHSAAARIATGYERRGSLELETPGATLLSVLPADSGAQLIAADGRLLRTAGADLPPTPLITVSQRRTVLGGRRVTTVAHGRTDSEPFRVYAMAVARAGGRQALVVASSLEGVNSAVHRVLVLLLIGGAAALLAVAGGGWWLARKALGPVARVTAQAERIEVDRLDERVSVPATADEIAQLATTLNRMLDRLRRGVDDKRRLIADASHELRTPLAVMRSELDVALAYGDLSPDAVRVLGSAREEVGRMTRTVQNLLTLARADDGRLDLLRRPLELRELVDEVAAELRPLAAERDVAVLAGGDRAVLNADRDRVRQVVANLVDNAVKYSRVGSEVRVAAWRAGREVGVRVEDHGVGIAAPDLPRVFDRFYRVDLTRGRGRDGSGLGLAICAEIVRAHGGRVWADSEEGRGSRFFAAFPVRDSSSS